MARRAARSPARRAPPSPADTPTSSAATDEAVLEAVLEAVQGQAGGVSVGRRSPFLRGLRERIKGELQKIAARRPSNVGGRGRAAVQRLRSRAAEVRERVQGQVVQRMRRRITGKEDQRVRDYVTRRMRAMLDEPPVIRLRDKVSFLCGVLGCFVIEAVALLAPRQFYLCYALFIVPLLALRVSLYHRKGWQYFLIDFCYASNAACLAQLALCPTSTRLALTNYLLTTGPLAMAVPTWRNSLVFHSLDRVTSSYIHVLPPLHMFCVRWFPVDGLALPPELPALPALRDAVAFYLCWQLFYVVCTELIFPPRVELDTSIRVLASGKPSLPPPACYSGITRLAYTACRALRIMADGERFDAEGAKTKAIFMSVQLLYTLASLALAALVYTSYYGHLAYLLGILACCVWNGASYYIEVFSKAYRKQFEGDTRALEADLLREGAVPDDEEEEAAEEEEEEEDEEEEEEDEEEEE